MAFDSRILVTLEEKGRVTLSPASTKITVGMASCGLASGAEAVYRSIQEQKGVFSLAQQDAGGRSSNFALSSTGCMGLCMQEPIVTVSRLGWPSIVYSNVTPDKAKEIVAALEENRVIPKYALCAIPSEVQVGAGTESAGLPAGLQDVIPYDQVPFFAHQERRLLRNCGLINPESIEEYVASGGYKSVARVLGGMKAEEVISTVSKSGLRGRGGAGFPTGRKWAGCRQVPSDVRYVICNADEGDPGAYMDRSLLEGDPHSIIEGMIIGAYAVGASSGYVYVRAEYPLAVKRVQQAIAQAKEHRLLGDNILGSDFSFSLDVECGSGAFVAGELSAMIASIEGSTAEPRQRPPGTTVKGLWGKPTVTNNVKTWANVPLIMSRGPDWWASTGTEKSKGTAVFSLVGKVKNTGLVEVPMGTTLRTLIYDVGGGVAGDKKLKAVQTGGPSGGCIPERLVDLPVDYERLAEAGSIMGSGGMVAMDQDTCMVDVAKFFIAFTKDESCGKCVPCREGCSRMHEILADITEGRGREGDIELLEELGKTISDSALCGLGESAPNPVLSTIRYFRDEYEAHIKDKKCPAGVCKSLISYFVDPAKCQACMICMRNCPVQAISGTKDQIHAIDQSKCSKCGTCFDVCPPRFKAVTKISGAPVPEPLSLEKRVLVRAR